MELSPIDQMISEIPLWMRQLAAVTLCLVVLPAMWLARK